MTAKSLLAVDIGNTSAHFCLSARGKLGREFRVKTSELRTSAVSAIRKHAALRPETVVVIASVVPAAALELKKAVSSHLRLPVLIVGKDIQVPITNRYRNPKQVGIDRLLNAYAAYKIYKRELVIIDFGTAITFDIVSAKGEYLGGIIAPGIELSLEALFQKTALLPKIRLQHPSALIARDTVESIRVGCSVGIGGLCDRIIEELGKTRGKRPLVLATGGYAEFMRRHCRSISRIDGQLVLKGIVWAYQAA